MIFFLVYCKRETGSSTLDYLHISLGCPTMFAEEERQVFIINVCLSCLPSCLYLHHCEHLERLLSSRVESPASPGASLLRKIIVNSPCQIRRNTKGGKKTAIQGAVLACCLSLQWWDMEYSLKISAITDLGGSPMCWRIKVRIATKIKEIRGVGWLHQLNITKATARCCPEGDVEPRCTQQQRWGQGLGAAHKPRTSQEEGGTTRRMGSITYLTQCMICHLLPGSTVEATAGGTALCRSWRQSGGNPEEQQDRKAGGLGNTAYWISK